MRKDLKLLTLLLVLALLFQDIVAFHNKLRFVSKNDIHSVSSTVQTEPKRLPSRHHSNHGRNDAFTLHALQRPRSSQRSKTTKPTKYRYLRALPSTGFYSQGGIYTEYLRAMRTQTKVEIEEGFVKADRNALTSFFLAPNAINIEECIVDEDGTACKRVILREIVPVSTPLSLLLLSLLLLSYYD